MADRGRIRNDIDNLVVCAERLQHEYGVLSFGGYLDEESLLALERVIDAVLARLETLRLEERFSL